MPVGVTEFSGTLYVPDESWQWQSRSVRMSTPDAMQAGLATGKGGAIPPYCGLGRTCPGQVRYGEITFTIHHLLVWLVNGYEWTPDYAELTARPDTFISGAELLASQEKDKQNITGAWGTSLSDVRGKFHGAEEPVKRW